MLKELVELVGAAERMNALAGNPDIGEELIDQCDVDAVRKAIDAATNAIGRHDDDKRKTDEAICLLFRAVEVAAGDYEAAAPLLARAERLLGFACLELAKT